MVVVAVVVVVVVVVGKRLYPRVAELRRPLEDQARPPANHVSADETAFPAAVIVECLSVLRWPSICGSGAGSGNDSDPVLRTGDEYRQATLPCLLRCLA